VVAAAGGLAGAQAARSAPAEAAAEYFKKVRRFNFVDIVNFPPYDVAIGYEMRLKQGL
jgi:hypothetical protein